MPRSGPQDCMDLQAGITPCELEVRMGGEMHLLCPCCGGSGEHPDLPGNNPDTLAYGCRTCQGQGDIDRDLERSPPQASRTAGPHPGDYPAPWRGASFTPELQVWPSPKGGWTITGQRGAASGGTGELLRMAHGVIEKLEDPRRTACSEWLRQYRRLTGCGQHQAQRAWERSRDPRRED